MAGWLTALKLVPWGDVIAAAPQVVRAAQGMLRKKDDAVPIEESAPFPSAHPLANAGELALTQVHALEQQVIALQSSQRQALELIQSLAEQNTQVVATVGALRVGTQRLQKACIVLGVAVVALTIALIWKA